MCPYINRLHFILRCPCHSVIIQLIVTHYMYLLYIWLMFGLVLEACSYA